MAEFVLKYADTRGEIHQQVAHAGSEKELRDRYSQQGFLIYSIKTKRRHCRRLSGGLLSKRKKLNIEKFLIFNQQFVTLIRAGLPILKALDLLADRLTDPKLGPYIKAVRDEVRNGTLLSDAFRMQGIFPKIYVTSVMAGEKSGSLAEVLDRFITYQKLSLAVKKKVMVSLMYPSVLIFLTLCLMVFLVTYVVPNFAELYTSMQAQLPQRDPDPDRGRHHRAQLYPAVLRGARGADLSVPLSGRARNRRAPTIDRREAARAAARRYLGEVSGGAILARAEHAADGRHSAGAGSGDRADSLGTPLLRKALDKAGKMVREGQALSASLKTTGIFPPLSIDMIEVGESTGALPAMLNSVAEFYEEDVNTRMTAALSLIEPAIMIFMGCFVAFVLIALYLPIFSLADTIR